MKKTQGTQYASTLAYLFSHWPPEPLFSNYSLTTEESKEDRGLFHYTTSEGLKGIVETNCIWATAATYLNDASEIAYGYTVVDEVFHEWEKINERNESFGVNVLHILRDMVNDNRKQLNSIPIYLACFCEKGNLLSQWRAYGQAGGYSIGFLVRSTDRSGLYGIGPPTLVNLKPDSDDYSAKLVRVIYQPGEQKKRLNDVLTHFLPLFDEQKFQEKFHELDPEERKYLIGTAALLIEHILFEEIVTFKNRAFAEEHEWRIIVRPNYRDGKDLKFMTAVHLRSARGLMVPYVKLAPTTDKLPIASVRFGPSLEKSRAENSLTMLFRKWQYENVIIRGSDIPVVL